MARNGFDAASTGRLSAPFTAEDLRDNAEGRLSPAQRDAVAADIRALARQRLISIGIGVVILLAFFFIGTPIAVQQMGGTAEQSETTRLLMTLILGGMMTIALLALLAYLLHALRQIAGLPHARVLAVSGVLEKHRTENLEGFVWNRITVGRARFLVHQAMYDGMQEGATYTLYYLADKSVLSYQRMA